MNMRLRGDKEMQAIIRALNKQWGKRGKGSGQAIWGVLLAATDGMVEQARGRVPVRTGRLRAALQKRTGYGPAGPVVGIGYKYRGRGRRRGLDWRQVRAAEYDVRQGGPFANALRHLINTQQPAMIARARRAGRIQMEKSAREAARRHGKQIVRYRRQRIR